MRLHNKIALITGASSGIGRQIALDFAAEGASVVLVGRDAKRLQETQRALPTNAKSAVVHGDVRKSADCAAMVAGALGAFGRLDILVNNAGVIAGGSAQTTSDDTWHNMFDTNLHGAFYLTRAAAQALAAAKGCVLNISSVTGIRPYAGLAAYCASKAALDMFTQCAALDFAPQGVRVNSINPGVVVTQLHRNGGMSESDYKAFVEKGAATHPLGRVGAPQDISRLAVFLCSNEASWITGGIHSVDGGRALTSLR